MFIGIKKRILNGVYGIAYYDNMKVVWNKVDKANWQSFHADHWGALQQSWAYGDALMAMDVVIHRAMVVSKGEGSTHVGSSGRGR